MVISISEDVPAWRVIKFREYVSTSVKRLKILLLSLSPKNQVPSNIYIDKRTHFPIFDRSEIWNTYIFSVNIQYFIPTPAPSPTLPPIFLS